MYQNRKAMLSIFNRHKRATQSTITLLEFLHVCKNLAISPVSSSPILSNSFRSGLSSSSPAPSFPNSRRTLSTSRLCWKREPRTN